MAKLNKMKAIGRLDKTLTQLRYVDSGSPWSPEFEKWERNATLAIDNVFGEGSSQSNEFFRKIPRENEFFDDHQNYNSYARGLGSLIALLESMIEEVSDYWEDENLEPALPPVQEDPTAEHKNRPPTTKEVFVIHGRDDETKVAVARLLEHLNLGPIILHEQSNQGRTIIEKFEHHAQVGFAIALLTPDDVGALQEDASNLEPRARQNVIFEFGYFIGRLGRNRVCALTKGNVEIPSDYDGVIYIPLDEAEGWKMKLVKELKDAGIDVDANRAFHAS